MLPMIGVMILKEQVKSTRTRSPGSLVAPNTGAGEESAMEQFHGPALAAMSEA
jgi:hypothetical protein